MTKNQQDMEACLHQSDSNIHVSAYIFLSSIHAFVYMSLYVFLSPQVTQLFEKNLHNSERNRT